MFPHISVNLDGFNGQIMPNLGRNVMRMKPQGQETRKSGLAQGSSLFSTHGTAQAPVVSPWAGRTEYSHSHRPSDVSLSRSGEQSEASQGVNFSSGRWPYLEAMTCDVLVWRPLPKGSEPRVKASI